MEDGARGGRQSHQPMLHWLMQGPSDRGVSWRQGQDSLTPNQGDGVKNTEGWGGVRKSLPQGPICCCGTEFQTWIHYGPDASCRQLCKLPSLSSVTGTKDTQPLLFLTSTERSLCMSIRPDTARLYPLHLCTPLHLVNGGCSECRLH